MIKSLRNLLISSLLGLCLAACSAGSTPTDTPKATRPTQAVTAATTAPPGETPTPKRPTQTPRPPTATPADTATAQATAPATAPATALATEQLPPTQSPTSALGAALEGPAISYNGVSFDLAPLLGDTIYTHDEQMYGAEVNYTSFTFAPEGWCQEVGCVEVYPLEQYQAAFPDYPLPPLGAATIIRAQDQALSFQNGDGARSIRMRGQDGFFANNEALVYDFQGYSDDGQFYVSIIIPIDAPILLSSADPSANTNAAAIPAPIELPGDPGQLSDVMREYNQEVERQLDLLAATDFMPSLSVLDALVTSLRVEALTGCPAPGEQPPRPFEVRQGQSVVENFEPQILDYLNAGGDVQGLQLALGNLTLPDANSDWQSRAQVLSADVTGDDTPEIVLDLSFFVAGQYSEGALFVYRCQTGQYVGGAVANIGGQVFSGDDPDPGIRAIQDVNGDGQAEIVFSYVTVIGTHANFSREFRIIQWDGDEFVDLIQGERDRPHAAQVLNGDGVLRDDDGDGVLELELTHGAERSLETSALERGHSDVWAWDGAAFTLAYSKDAPPVFRIHAAWDGDMATLRGDYDDALAFYEQVIFDGTLLDWAGGDPDESSRLTAYARYRIMLLHIVRGNQFEADVMYDILQRFPGEVGGRAFAALATAFWNEYEYNTNRDITAACGKAVEYAATHAAEVLDPLGSAFYGRGWPDYVPNGVCPFQR
jgi:hypothetical protein